MLSGAEAATLYLMSDAMGPLAVVARNVWTRRQGRVVQPALPVINYLGEAIVAWGDEIEYWNWWTKAAVWPYDFGVKV